MLHSRLTLVVCVISACAPVALHAQSYPARASRIVIPFAPGGGTDNLTRIMEPKLTALLGQQILIENRPGASGQIGTELVARAAPDGYTLAHVDTSFTSNPSLFRKLPYDTVKDFAPVSLLASAPVVVFLKPPSKRDFQRVRTPPSCAGLWTKRCALTKIFSAALCR